MKGRPKNIRIITSIPTVSGFKPYGESVTAQKHKAIFLNFEEYEAIRLNDYQKHTQCESAALMGVSRPTFTRIYMCAREKIAKAFIEGCRIIIEGGKVRLNDQWRICNKCGAIFSTINDCDNYTCALCGSDDVTGYDENNSDDAKIAGIAAHKHNQRSEMCMCKGCGRKRYFNK